MEKTKRKVITVETTVNAPIDTVWEFWTGPSHIVKWNNASDDWHTTHAENDARTGGRFMSRMEAKDGSAGFDFAGVYDEVIPNQLISYAMEDGRKVKIHFSTDAGKTTVTETFEAEEENPLEMQREGWQAILDNFKKYAEANKQ